MDNNISQASALEIAIILMKQKHGKQNIRKLITEVLEVQGLDDEDMSLATQIYIDITTSAKFVYMGNEEWDLKERQPVELWAKDGSEFRTKEDLSDEEIEDDDDEESFEKDIKKINFEYGNEDEDSDEEIEDDYNYSYGEIDLETDENGDILDRYDEENDFDEDKYNDIMDDYEDIY